MLQQYLGAGAGKASSQAHDDFDRVAAAVPRDDVADGLADAFRSDQTPPFPQMLSHLFGQSSGGQRASILNQLIGAAGPGVLSGLLGHLAGQGQITPEEAERVPPEAVERAAAEAERHDPGIVDSVSRIYAEHPQLIKTLGAAALTIALAKIAGKRAG